MKRTVPVGPRITLKPATEDVGPCTTNSPPSFRVKVGRVVLTAHWDLLPDLRTETRLHMLPHAILFEVCAVEVTKVGSVLKCAQYDSRFANWVFKAVHLHFASVLTTV